MYIQNESDLALFEVKTEHQKAMKFNKGSETALGCYPQENLLMHSSLPPALIRLSMFGSPTVGGQPRGRGCVEN